LISDKSITNSGSVALNVTKNALFPKNLDDLKSSPGAIFVSCQTNSKLGLNVYKSVFLCGNKFFVKILKFQLVSSSIEY
jgi:hypothetical protein